MNIPAIELKESVQQALKPHAIVIGSGFGGLAAAIRLGAKGYRVTVLEKLDRPGGRARVHRQDGFTFDAGPTIITAPFLLEELWQLAGRRFADDVELRLMDPFYRIRFDDGDTFDYRGDPEANRREIARFHPDDVSGYDRFMTAAASNYRVGFEQLVDRPFSTLWDMVKVLPDMLRLRADRSVHNMVSRYVKDERLRMVLSFHPLLIGGNPYSASSVYTLISHLERIGGVFSAVGGTGAIVNGMAGLIAGQGNALRCNAEVARILVQDGRACGVSLTSGEDIAADLVVSNADTAWTYRHLLPDVKRRRWHDRKLNRAKYSNGLFVWYFGTDRRYEDVCHHSILLGPRYRGLLDDIFKHKRLASDFSLYLHRPTATDPALAPAGCDCFYVLAPVPNLDANIDWEQQAEPFRAAIQRHLSDTVLPGLENHVISSLVTTPRDFETDLNAYLGAGFGMEPVLWQSAWFRPHNLSEEVRGLYFVGAGTHPGAGVPGVISSAKVIESLVPHAHALV
jgi:phytoene desaturase